MEDAQYLSVVDTDSADVRSLPISKVHFEEPSECYTDTDSAANHEEPVTTRWSRLVKFLNFDHVPPSSSRASSPEFAQRRSTFDISHSRMATTYQSEGDNNQSEDETYRMRRRSFHIPRPSTKTRDRMKGVLSKIKDMKMPRGLLKRNRNIESSPDSSGNFAVLPLTSVMMSERTSAMLNLVDLRIRDLDLDVDDHAFIIDLSYGQMRWSVRRSIVDLFRLHSQLTFRQLQHKIHNLPKFPSQIHYAFSRVKALLPKHHHHADVSKEFLMLRLKNKRRQAMGMYLRNVLKQCSSTPITELLMFLELGTCITDGFKGKEGLIKFGRRRLISASSLAEVWLIVRDSYIACYDNIQDEHPQKVLFFDSETDIETSRYFSQSPFSQHKFHIWNETKKWTLRADSDRQLTEFMNDIKYCLSRSPWGTRHRFNSFAPIRNDAKAQFFVDGSDYFDSVYQAISNAKKCVYIEDWWLTPEFFLKRPPSRYPASRLDRLLQMKAKEGVLIYVIIYKEVSFSLGIQSSHSKQVLARLHRNIKVLRFPDHVGNNQVLYWALHDKMLIVDEDYGFLGGFDMCLGRWDTCDHHVSDFESSEKEIWGQDYSNPRICDFRNVDQVHTSLVDKQRVARMPWHDVGVGIFGQSARDLARHFIQRWNFIKGVKCSTREDIPHLLPPRELTIAESRLMGLNGTCTIQLLRSASPWSLGINDESSVYDAYIELIRDSRHYIYIENQFFISTARDGSVGYAQNLIAEALCQRIIRAHRNRESFKVFIVMPLLPAFENDVSEANATTLRLVLHWHQTTISRGDMGIFAVLGDAGIQPEHYITICSLRNHGSVGNASTPGAASPVVTEQVYIHSKVMIVDDEYAISGSANINDRSMLGSRDSEIAAIITDSETLDITMHGKLFRCSKSVFNLRCKLFGEHLGLDIGMVEKMDIVSDTFWRFWLKRAEKNTLIYRKVFHCIPDDTVHTWEDYATFTDSPFRLETGHVHTNVPADVIRDNLSAVNGNLVLYPTQFLKKETLNNVFLTAEYVVPSIVYM